MYESTVDEKHTRYNLSDYSFDGKLNSFQKSEYIHKHTTVSLKELIDNKNLLLLDFNEIISLNVTLGWYQCLIPNSHIKTIKIWLNLLEYNNPSIEYFQPLMIHIDGCLMGIIVIHLQKNPTILSDNNVNYCEFNIIARLKLVLMIPMNICKFTKFNNLLWIMKGNKCDIKQNYQKETLSTDKIYDIKYVVYESEYITKGDKTQQLTMRSMSTSANYACAHCEASKVERTDEPTPTKTMFTTRNQENDMLYAKSATRTHDANKLIESYGIICAPLQPVPIHLQMLSGVHITGGIIGRISTNFYVWGAKKNDSQTKFDIFNDFCRKHEFYIKEKMINEQMVDIYSNNSTIATPDNNMVADCTQHISFIDEKINELETKKQELLQSMNNNFLNGWNNLMNECNVHGFYMFYNSVNGHSAHEFLKHRKKICKFIKKHDMQKGLLTELTLMHLNHCLKIFSLATEELTDHDILACKRSVIESFYCFRKLMIEFNGNKTNMGDKAHDLFHLYSFVEHRRITAGSMMDQRPEQVNQLIAKYSNFYANYRKADKLSRIANKISYFAKRFEQMELLYL